MLVAMLGTNVALGTPSSAETLLQPDGHRSQDKQGVF